MPPFREWTLTIKCQNRNATQSPQASQNSRDMNAHSHFSKVYIFLYSHHLSLYSDGLQMILCAPDNGLFESAKCGTIKPYGITVRRFFLPKSRFDVHLQAQNATSRVPPCANRRVGKERHLRSERIVCPRPPCRLPRRLVPPRVPTELRGLFPVQGEKRIRRATCAGRVMGCAAGADR